MFTAAEKLRIVKKADACLASGERGAIEAMLREEGLYSSALSTWRAQLGARGAGGLEPCKMGRKPKLDAKPRSCSAGRSQSDVGPWSTAPFRRRVRLVAP